MSKFRRQVGKSEKHFSKLIFVHIKALGRNCGLNLDICPKFCFFKFPPEGSVELCTRSKFILGGRYGFLRRILGLECDYCRCYAKVRCLLLVKKARTRLCEEVTGDVLYPNISTLCSVDNMRMPIRKQYRYDKVGGGGVKS